ncbi:protein LYRIC isoform X2 [Engystomops pustulosus]|uniref:protein LYRIC isoform X2 n=1 Tax=Engystomops pustulosus TaxID=76066 RepID=UPI003AFA4B16
MSAGWQEAAAQQAEEVSARLRQLLITGLGLLRSELGLELGLEPQRYPSWVFLAVPFSLGLGLLFILLHCATSRGSPSPRRPPQHEKEQPLLQARAPVPIKSTKVEEPKKKSKKKPAEKAKPNGRPVEPAEEVVVPPVKKESPKSPKQPKPPQQPAEAEKKTEKAVTPKEPVQLKKNKKKPKVETKPTQPSPKEEKKESEEGNWETKISNKEKRQQRKRDKGADGDGDIASPVVEAFTVTSTQSTNVRKSKGPSEASALNGSSWNEKPSKVIASQLVEEKWVTSTNTAGKKKAEPVTWNQDTVDSNGKEWSGRWNERSIFPGIGSWPRVDSRLNTSEKRQTFSTIGLNNAVSVSDPVSQTSVDHQWEVPEPSVDDEWSGLNGLNSADASSDWNAPAEVWGNYGEEEPVPGQQREEPDQEVPKGSDDEKEKDEQDGQASAASKSKKKKKKKKKQGEESGSPTEEAESTKNAGDGRKVAPAPPTVTPVIPTAVAKSNVPKEKKQAPEKRTHTVLAEAPAKHNVSEKAPAQPQQPKEVNTSVTKQNNVAPPSQAKSEESWESPKQVKKKKKARRET